MKTVSREELYEQVWFKPMIRQRLKQIDALVSPHFLDISARSSKVDFAEPDPEKEAESGSGYFYYRRPSTSGSGLSAPKRSWSPRARSWNGQAP